MSETVPKPIDWSNVAYVAFKDGKPVILSSAEPHVLANTFADLLKGADDDEFCDEESYELGVAMKQLENAVDQFEWKLYSVEDAKAVFCAGWKESQR